MDHKFRWNINSASIDFLLILALLCVFAFGALMAVILGSNSYKGIKEDMDSNYELRTPLSYISTKVRQSDDIDSIRLIDKDGIDALVLEKADGEEICQTWIYEYQGSLYEVYIEKDQPFLLEEGIEIIPSYGLTFDLNGNLLEITSKDHSGKARSLTLSFRSQQGGGLQ